MTEQATVSIEKIEDEIYSSNKNMFEFLLFRCAEKARTNDLTYTDDMRALLKAYNDMADSAKRLSKLLRVERPG